jgi:hypothetical protein
MNTAFSKEVQIAKSGGRWMKENGRGGEFMNDIFETL